jgi:hypothetical protein
MVAVELCLYLLLVPMCIMFGSVCGIDDGGMAAHSFHPLLYSALLDSVQYSKNNRNSNCDSDNDNESNGNNTAQCSAVPYSTALPACKQPARMQLATMTA